MTNNFNPTEWSTSKETAELTTRFMLTGVPVAVLDKSDKEDCRETYS
jgi:hypothetical protein